ncbi:hypothetical protein MLOOGBEN_23170 [Bacillus sp. EB106-08-02-XG196]|uniref:hypothetical protein n=1 Tax=Bacillus sp. EB106-08-02-XG196 TaxID=2737049 RepID=UPI0015C475F6|nr:hypothetical protein [Bacillus sp. EB106-08-02-XG196]NWQ43603.1 hypothetical protein [Bacillus sp. EB106-08-02-XG196]
MPPIRIQTDYVKRTGASIGPMSQKVSEVSDGLSALRYAIDHKIMNRGNLRSRFNAAITSSHQLETRIRDLDRFIAQSMDQYCRTETELTKKSESAITPESKKSTIASILNVFNYINGKLSIGDAALVGTQLFTIALSAGISRKLKINYIGGKPTFWKKIKGDYKFTVGAHPSWKSRGRGRYDSKLARAIYNFSKSSPANPIVKQLQKIAASYNNPSALLKHAAGYPKNLNLLKADTLSGTFQKRITTGTKEIAEHLIDAKGWTKVAKKVPVAGMVISVAANAAEIWDPDNADKTRGERLGRTFAGISSDLVAIGAGAKVGAMIGSVGGPVGIVVGGAVGALVGGVGSIVFEDQIKDVGEKLGGAVETGIKDIGEGINNTFKSVGSWFN